MSHDAPRLHNDIRHYSRLMLLPLPCHTAASGQDAEQPVFQSSAYGSMVQKGEVEKIKNPDVIWPDVFS